MNNSFKDYLTRVADYIEMEYGPYSDFTELSNDEKFTIKHILEAHYALNNSINNAANDVMSYIRENRAWMKNNIK